MSREQMEADLAAGLFVEAGQYNGNFYGTSLKAVRMVAAEVCPPCLVDAFMDALHWSDTSSPSSPWQLPFP